MTEATPALTGLMNTRDGSRSLGLLTGTASAPESSSLLRAPTTAALSTNTVDGVETGVGGSPGHGWGLER